MASPLLLQRPPSTLSSTPTLVFIRNTHLVPSPIPSSKPSSYYYYKTNLTLKSITVPFALTESEGSTKSLDEPDPDSKIQILLQQLADSFVLPPDYFGQLPGDLRLDLNDAAFDLSNGAVIDECGQDLGETLLNISRAWEVADTSTSTTLVGKLPLIVGSLTGNAKSAFGKRLVSAGRRFQSMGQYGQGELPRFGDLQVELTPEKAYTGAAIGLVFGILSWQISQGIQSIPESSLQYANDNALLLAKSLRGALLALFYSSTLLSVFSAMGLVLLGGQLKSKEK
ncbi:uncharacterized protein LOC130764484 isoform X2 [Actinidia eriantha]|uniref:uncharacterized protein LOC130764484 isoform X2 n=1 Tax=Actinidia eriantha TaxID=165200 RepID=UPI00258B8E78|nr:uncharacterized protein LOC130764484 isoform X2 [Actinidia eriantha]